MTKRFTNCVLILLLCIFPRVLWAAQSAAGGPTAAASVSQEEWFRARTMLFPLFVWALTTNRDEANFTSDVYSEAAKLRAFESLKKSGGKWTVTDEELEEFIQQHHEKIKRSQEFHEDGLPFDEKGDKYLPLYIDLRAGVSLVLTEAGRIEIFTYLSEAEANKFPFHPLNLDISEFPAESQLGLQWQPVARAKMTVVTEFISNLTYVPNPFSDLGKEPTLSEIYDPKVHPDGVKAYFEISNIGGGLPTIMIWSDRVDIPSGYVAVHRGQMGHRWKSALDLQKALHAMKNADIQRLTDNYLHGVRRLEERESLLKCNDELTVSKIKGH